MSKTSLFLFSEEFLHEMEEMSSHTTQMAYIDYGFKMPRVSPKKLHNYSTTESPRAGSTKTSRKCYSSNADHSVKAMFCHKVKHVQIVLEAVFHMIQMTCCPVEHASDMVKVVPCSIELTFCSIV